MRSIEIDDEVYAYLQKSAIAFVEAPNDTLRRLLGMNVKKENKKELSLSKDKNEKTRRKKRKASLLELVDAGLLENGQSVFLRDYQKKIHKKYEALIVGKELFYKNKYNSMSEVAKNVLKELGHRSDSVRGPFHWVNNDGVSISELWDRYLG